ncbi:ABC transporter substrate-binding protein [Halovenus sp. HT40]|uniref:ABC transporter substrate-binding protein n=1 Tax=Halovenus sp. HT40 TaxID=3126691 RepID=UPI00300EEDE8
MIGEDDERVEQSTDSDAETPSNEPCADAPNPIHETQETPQSLDDSKDAANTRISSGDGDDPGGSPGIDDDDDADDSDGVTRRSAIAAGAVLAGGGALAGLLRNSDDGDGDDSDPGPTPDAEPDPGPEQPPEDNDNGEDDDVEPVDIRPDFDPVEHLESNTPAASTYQTAFNGIRDPALSTEDWNRKLIEMETALQNGLPLIPIGHAADEVYYDEGISFDAADELVFWQLRHNTTTIDTDITGGDSRLRIPRDDTTVDGYSLDPVSLRSIRTELITRQVFDRLTEPRSEPGVEYNLLDDATEADDGLSWTLTLSSDATFHNGDPVTAHDVKYSWRRGIESENSKVVPLFRSAVSGIGLAHRRYYPGENTTDDGTGLEVLDDDTLRVHLAKPQPNFLELISTPPFSVIPEGIIGDIDGYTGNVPQGEFEQAPIGSGPFTVRRHDPAELTQLDGFDDYHGPGPSIDGLDYPAYDFGEDWNAFVDGDVNVYIHDTFGDGLLPLGTDDVSLSEAGQPHGTLPASLELGSDRGDLSDLSRSVQYSAATRNDVHFLLFNVANVPTSVRHAVAYALDQPEFLSESARTFTPAYSYQPPRLWEQFDTSYDEFAAGWPYHPVPEDERITWVTPSAVADDDEDRTEARAEGIRQWENEMVTAVLNHDGYTVDDPYELTIDVGMRRHTAPFINRLQTRVNDADMPLTITTKEPGDVWSGEFEATVMGSDWLAPDRVRGFNRFDPGVTNVDVTGAAFPVNWHTELDGAAANSDSDSGSGS